MKVGNAQFRREEAVLRPVYSVTRNRVIPMSSNISRNIFQMLPRGGLMSTLGNPENLEGYML